MKVLIFILSGITSVFSIAQQTHEYKVAATYHIASPGGWDYLVVHKGKLYVSHSSQVNILNVASGDSLGVIPNTQGVHGITFDEAGRGFTSNGRSNDVTVFDVQTSAIKGQIATGENPDAIIYDPFTKYVITCNGRSKNLSIIDPGKTAVVSTIDVGGKPETAVSDGKGRLFVNIEDKNEIVEVDLKKAIVINRWSLDGAESPTGLAYDKLTNRLFAGCDKQLVVMDAANGKLITKLPIGEGCDGVAFYPKEKIIFTSNGRDGTITAIKEEGPEKFSVLGNYVTKRGGRTIAIDTETGTLYIPTADFEPGEMVKGRPKVVPGSFQVLVIR